MTATPPSPADSRSGLVQELAAAAADAAIAGAEVSLRLWGRPSELVVHTKQGPDDLVSNADIESQSAITETLRSHRPKDLVKGEEDSPFTQEAPDSEEPTDIVWLVDPIDGTTSFVYGRADWSVSVAAVSARDGAILAAAVAEPVLGVLTTAAVGAGTWRAGHRLSIRGDIELSRALVDLNLGRHDQRERAGDLVGMLAREVRDIRRGGSAAAALANLASGQCDAVWVPGLQAWDGAAGILLATEAGAVVGDLGGPTGARWPASGDVLAAGERTWNELRSRLEAIYR
jgi:myo-inositol-1(or 4)-monophosphatase